MERGAACRPPVPPLFCTATASPCPHKPTPRTLNCGNASTTCSASRKVSLKSTVRSSVSPPTPPAAAPSPSGSGGTVPGTRACAARQEHAVRSCPGRHRSVYAVWLAASIPYVTSLSGGVRTDGYVRRYVHGGDHVPFYHVTSFGITLVHKRGWIHVERTCAAAGSPYPRNTSCSQGGMTAFSSFMRSRIDSSTALKLFSLALRLEAAKWFIHGMW